jgi:hypothetical protein
MRALIYIFKTTLMGEYISVSSNGVISLHASRHFPALIVQYNMHATINAREVVINHNNGTSYIPSKSISISCSISNHVVQSPSNPPPAYNTIRFPLRRHHPSKQFQNGHSINEKWALFIVLALGAVIIAILCWVPGSECVPGHPLFC